MVRLGTTVCVPPLALSLFYGPLSKGALTRPRRTAQGANAIPAKTKETTLGGTFCSGRKVWKSSGWGWKVTSSGWTGAGWDAGKTRSKRDEWIGS
jgi:hypothetical protein